MTRQEVVLRLAFFLPLFFITYQVTMLRRVLRSRSWTSIMIGFIVFALMVGITVIVRLSTEARLVFMLLGYTLIAAGLHMLRNDIHRLREQRRLILSQDLPNERKIMTTVISKSLFASKVFWLGVAQLAVGVIDLVKTNVLESETAAWGAVVSGALTIVLRLLTKQPVTLKGGEPKQIPNGKAL
jgi:hypothetical protein